MPAHLPGIPLPTRTSKEPGLTPVASKSNFNRYSAAGIARHSAQPNLVKVFARMARHLDVTRSNPGRRGNDWGGFTWMIIAIGSVVWFALLGQGSLRRSVLLACLGLASFISGSFVGFLFSSYGEEDSTLGKLRDWLIGAITALSVAKASSLKAVLVVFAADASSTEFAYTLGTAVLYAGIGFYFMYFYREIILNLTLARSRAERGKLEGSQQAGQVVQRFLLRLPASVLTGVDDIDDVGDVNKEEAENLKGLLYSADVDEFLKQADDAVKEGTADWDVVSKAAYIAYYRTYFGKDNQAAAVAKASEWITRALNMIPLHVDLTMKYAEMLAAKGEYEAATALLERLELRSESPFLVWQWLGYYLRFLPNRLDDAIRYSERYHSVFPEETDSLFNIAYACCRKYCQAMASGAASEATTAIRQKAFDAFRRALKDQPEMKEKIRTEWIKDGTGLECMAGDDEFKSIVT